MKAIILFIQGYSDEAIKLIDNSLNEDEKNPGLFNLKGYMLRDLGKDRLAFNLYKKAVKANPNDPFLLVNLAELYYKLDDNVDKSIKLIDKAIKIEPHDEWYEFKEILSNIY